MSKRRPQPGDITAVLEEWSRGEPGALDRLISRVFDDLRKIAHAYFKKEDVDHTLQPTALVSELCIRLMGWRKVQWENRKQFFSFAGQFMRYILIDYAKARRTELRGGKLQIVPLTGDLDRPMERSLDSETLLDLDRALAALARVDSRATRVVELRYFCGLTIAEVAVVLEISPATVRRDWSMARRFLARELAKEPEHLFPDQ